MAIFYLYCMEKDFAKLLKVQLKKLNSKDFDLEAWKSSTSAVLSMAFGADDPQVHEIQKLKIDYGSWALRDAKASYDPIETCKKIGKEVVEIALSQLGDSKEINSDFNSILENQLTDKSLKEIRKVLKSTKSDSKKKEKVEEILKGLDTENLASILAELILKSEN